MQEIIFYISKIKNIEINHFQNISCIIKYKNQFTYRCSDYNKTLLKSYIFQRSFFLSQLQTFYKLYILINQANNQFQEITTKMISIINQDGTLNQDLTEYPNANASIAIFGTQSTGKSTLINNAFGTSFPVLNTKQDRKRCTKGVWFQHVNDFNIIDTEGFDSVQRKAQQKILQKQIALFCLAMADVVIINIWMNELGRYQGSHTHILKSIIKVSQRLISSQQKNIIFVIKDCTDDADRRILKQQLQIKINSIINQVENKQKSPKLNIEYHFMSHFFYKKAVYQKQAKQLKNMIKVKRSYLSNYSPEDRIIYIKDLWQKITSAQNQIDLKSIEDAVMNYALERIKSQTIQFCYELIKEVKDLQRHKSFQRFNQFIKKQSERKFYEKKPVHIGQREINQFLFEIKEILEYPISKQFSTIILPAEQQKLLTDLEKSFSQNQKSRQLQKLIIKKRKETTDLYKKLIAGHKQSLSLVKKFSQKINEIVVRYQRQISHLFNMFENRLEKQLNDELDRQLGRKTIYFDGKQIDQRIKKVCGQFQYNQWEINFKDMWEKISHRAINQKLPQRIEQLSKEFTQNVSIWTGDQTTNVLAYHRKLQKQCQQFCRNVLNYFEQENIIYQPFDKIKDQINNLMQKAVLKQRTRFHITLLLLGFFMWFFYGEFVYFLSMLPMKKKKRGYWVNLYTFSLALIFVISIYNRRNQIRKYLGIQ